MLMKVWMYCVKKLGQIDCTVQREEAKARLYVSQLLHPHQNCIVITSVPACEEQMKKCHLIRELLRRWTTGVRSAAAGR